MPPLSHLTFCTPTKSNLYLAHSLATVNNWPCAIQAPYIPRTKSHVPYPLLRSYQRPVQARGTYICFVQKGQFLRLAVVINSPKPQAGGPPVFCCPRMFIQYIRSYCPYWRPFLHPQPEDALCPGDRDPFMVGWRPSLVLMIAPFLCWRNNTLKASRKSCHCIALQKNIASIFDKKFTEQVWKAIRNHRCIQASRFSDRVFQELLKEPISCSRDVPSDSEDSWLNTCRAFDRFYNLDHEIMLQWQ